MKYLIQPYLPIEFNDVILYIYSIFRCFYIHEGIDPLTIPNNNISYISGGRLIRSKENKLWWKPMKLLNDIEFNRKKDVYCVIQMNVDMDKVVEWFGKITFESLFAILKQIRIYPPPQFLDY